MPKTTAARSQRIDVRTVPEVKALIERAALLRHTSVSAYLLDSALEKAKADLSAIETVSLRDSDRDLFFAALASPPAPNAALRKLFADGRGRGA